MYNDYFYASKKMFVNMKSSIFVCVLLMAFNVLGNPLDAPQEAASPQLYCERGYYQHCECRRRYGYDSE